MKTPIVDAALEPLPFDTKETVAARLEKRARQLEAERATLIEALKIAAEYVYATEGVVPRGPDGRNLVSPIADKIRVTLLSMEIES